jgi:hypothetical protein
VKKLIFSQSDTVNTLVFKAILTFTPGDLMGDNYLMGDNCKMNHCKQNYRRGTSVSVFLSILSAFILSALTVFTLSSLHSCSDNSSDSQPSPTGVEGVVSDTEGSPVADAVILLYDARSNSPLTRVVTGADGSWSIEIDSGSYYVRVQAQGFDPLPISGTAPLVFSINQAEMTQRDVILQAAPDAENTGSLSGSVSGLEDLSGILIVASDGESAYSGTTGPDGYYDLFNVPPGTYTLEAYTAGARLSNDVSVDVSSGNSASGETLQLEEAQNPSIFGSISFLASENSVVDITLIHPLSHEAIPGLLTQNEATGQTYTLSDVPPGNYIVWASYANDGYVMDPDRIAKFGLPLVEVADEDLEMNFDITGAIEILSPGNSQNNLIPDTIHTANPVFSWNKYASTKEYIIEVSNTRGEIIWGGYQDSIIQHASIGAQKEEIEFNFDGSASGSIQSGELYRWKLYADSDDEENIQGLISSSEEQRGLFVYFPEE